jgi:hypothetical protein
MFLLARSNYILNAFLIPPGIAIPMNNQVQTEKRSPMNAMECTCCKCNKQAVAFWPVFDPDIPRSPYCRECLDAEKNNFLVAMYKDGLFQKSR